MVSIKKRLASVLTLFAFSLSLAVGFSSFEYQDSTEVRTTVSTSYKVPCCYISGKAKKYTHIEGALKDAVSGETVIVIPGTNPTIETSCTVPKGVTLSIRYEENTEPITNPKDANDSTGSFSTDCKNTITVSEDVVITNYGNILVGGHLSGGSGGSNACGHTGYEYVDVILKKSAQIVNESGGSLTCYGYIKEDSTEPTYDDNGNSTRLSNDVRGVYAKSGSTVSLPFIVRDFRGGSISLKMVVSILSKHVSPFNQFDIRNISAPLYADSGATVQCVANIIANNANNNTSFNLVGSNALFTLNSNASFMMDVLPNTDGIAVYKSYGSLSMNSISINMGGQDVSSDSFDLPISFRQRIYLNANKDGSSCTVNLPYFYKILPGGVFCINTNVTANLPSGGTWYNPKDYARLWGYYDGLSLPTGYPTGYGNIGKIMVNGKVTSNKMAGYITTTNTSGTASFNASNTSLTCYDYSTENTTNYRKEYSPKLYYYNSSGGYAAASKGITYTSASGSAYFK